MEKAMICCRRRITQAVVSFFLCLLSRRPCSLRVPRKQVAMNSNLWRQSSREDCKSEMFSIWRYRPQPRIKQADIADLFVKRWIVFKHRGDAIWIRTREE